MKVAAAPRQLSVIKLAQSNAVNYPRRHCHKNKRYLVKTPLKTIKMEESLCPALPRGTHPKYKQK